MKGKMSKVSLLAAGRLELHSSRSRVSKFRAKSTSLETPTSVPFKDGRIFVADKILNNGHDILFTKFLDALILIGPQLKAAEIHFESEDVWHKFDGELRDDLNSGYVILDQKRIEVSVYLDLMLNRKDAGPHAHLAAIFGKYAPLIMDDSVCIMLTGISDGNEPKIFLHAQRAGDTLATFLLNDRPKKKETVVLDGGSEVIFHIKVEP